MRANWRRGSASRRRRSAATKPRHSTATGAIRRRSDPWSARTRPSPLTRSGGAAWLCLLSVGPEEGLESAVGGTGRTGFAKGILICTEVQANQTMDPEIAFRMCVEAGRSASCLAYICCSVTALNKFSVFSRANSESSARCPTCTASWFQHDACQNLRNGRTSP